MTSIDELAELDATAQAALVAAGEVAPAELVTAAVARIEEGNARLNAVIHRRDERALQEAAGGLPDGPFRGVPLVLKDIGCQSRGDPYHAGTGYLRRLDHRAAADSRLTTHFRAAGFVIVGRTNTPELAMSMTTEPAAYGPTRNPWDPQRTAGGSSGGSAAAVAARMVPVGHGADGGGSLRIPASACGLVGLKPSRGRVPEDDHDASWRGLLAQHVLTRTIRDTAGVLDVLGTPPPGGGSWRALAGLRSPRLKVGVLDHPPGTDAAGDVECTAAVHRVARALEDLGHHVVDEVPEGLDDPEFGPAFATLVALVCAAEVARLARLTGGDPDSELEPATLALARRGRETSAEAEDAAGRRLEAFTRRTNRFWSGEDALLLSPTLNGPPPPLGWLADPHTAADRAGALLAYARPANATGQPSIALPLHRAGGLPIGVQLTAATGREDLLLQVATELEEALPWAR